MSKCKFYEECYNTFKTDNKWCESNNPRSKSIVLIHRVCFLPYHKKVEASIENKMNEKRLIK